MHSVMIEPGLHVVRLDTAHVARAAARVQIRAALCQLIATTIGVSCDEVQIRSIPGKAPELLIKGHLSAHGVSISHVDQFACAAFNTRGAVGIDVQQVQEMPDMARVALEYLGPAVRDLLKTIAPARRAHAFAHAWTRREAHLKFLGLELSEFIPLPDNCRVLALTVPEGFAGALVTAAVPQHPQMSCNA